MVILEGMRRIAAAGTFALGAAFLGGCTAQQQANLQTNLDGSAGQARPQIASPGNTAGSAAAPADKTAATDISKTGEQPVLESQPAGDAKHLAIAPVPVPRPDFGDRILVAKLPGDVKDKKTNALSNALAAPTKEVVLASNAAQPVTAQPVPQKSAGNPATAPAFAAHNAIAQAAPARSAPAPVRVASAASEQSSIFGSLFSSPKRPPGHEEANDPEPPLSAAEERIERSVQNDGEATPDGTPVIAPPAIAELTPVSPASPSVPANPAPASSGPVVVTTAAGPPAVIEVNGKTENLGSGSAHGVTTKARVIRTAYAPVNRPQIQGRSIAGSVRYWKANHPSVRTRCFGPKLRNALNMIGRHYGRTVEVTSGHRTRGRRRSMHRFCRAADIRVAGVRPSRLARFARRIPGINGVGTYRRKSIVHIDTRLRRMVWRY